MDLVWHKPETTAPNLLYLKSARHPAMARLEVPKRHIQNIEGDALNALTSPALQKQARNVMHAPWNLEGEYGDVSFPCF